MDLDTSNYIFPSALLLSMSEAAYIDPFFGLPIKIFEDLLLLPPRFLNAFEEKKIYNIFLKKFNYREL